MMSNTIQEDLIPDIDDSYLIQIDTKNRANPLLAVVEISRQFITKKKKKSVKESSDSAKPFPAIYFMTNKAIGFDDLPNLQSALNKSYAYSYGIVVFKNECIPVNSSRKIPCLIKPIYDGNPRANFQVPILQYEKNGRLEYCGIRDVGKAFGVEKYCLKCMRGGPQCPCETKVNI